MFQLLQPPFPLCAPVLPCMFELVGRKKNTYTGIRKPDSIVGGQTMQRQECVKPRRDAPRERRSGAFWDEDFSVAPAWGAGNTSQKRKLRGFLVGKEGSPSQNLIEHSPQRYGT